jgi:N-acetylglutamate synthase-like GNAT family acetyltransferase
MKQRIRPYEPEDHSACKALWVELTERHRDIYGDATIGGEDPGQGLDAYLSNPNRRVTWVAEIGGKVVGMAGLIAHGEEGEVEPVVVARPYRRRGVGRMLVEEALSHARKIRIRFLSVRPVARNAEAISFFVEAGFNIVGHIDLFQDLAQSSGRDWKTGIAIHGKQLRY